MEYLIGESYSIPCAQIRLREDDKTFFIPVFDHAHTDPQFGFPHRHYHIDARFDIEPRMLQYFKIKEGHTSAVLTPDAPTTYTVQAITYRTLTCVRANTGISLPEIPNPQQQEKIDAYHQWYQRYIGQACNGRKCPHFGTTMLNLDNKLVCPMHGLMADASTLKNYRFDQ